MPMNIQLNAKSELTFSFLYVLIMFKGIVLILIYLEVK